MDVEQTAPNGAKSDYQEPTAFREPVALDFIAVVQCDYAPQMDVFRWLLNDASYACIWIQHDKDTFTADDIAERAEKAWTTSLVRMAMVRKVNSSG